MDQRQAGTCASFHAALPWQGLRPTWRSSPVFRERRPGGEISANCYGNARRLLAKADGLSESVPEISARLLFESEGLAFRRQVQIHGVGRVDFLIGRRLIVEVNGYAFHSSREAWRKDLARLNAAQARGFDLLSFAPETIWNNPVQVMKEIRATLALDKPSLP